jgi:hypothetical protein
VEKKLKMPRRYNYFVLALLLLLSSCTGHISSGQISSAPAISAFAHPTITPSSPGAFLDSPTLPPHLQISPDTTQSPPGSSTLPVYTLDASLDYPAHSVLVDETINYQNATGVPLPELVLAVEPNLWTGSFVLGGLLINGQDPGTINLTGDRLVVPLGIPLISGEKLILSLQYALHLPPADIHHVYGFNTRQLNLVDWYPFIVPYSDGWVLHPPANVGEHLAYGVADFDVSVTQVDQSTPVILAASGAADKSTSGWHYRLKNDRTFVLSASPAYKTLTSITSGVTITSYYFTEDETAARAVLDATSSAVKIYGEMFGPYLHTSLSIVESPFFDGMEYDGLYFLGQDYYASYDGTMLNNLVDIAVHETSHQWWFGRVGNDQAMEPWLDEAMATYSEDLFYEKNLPQISPWWLFRVESFSPAGWVDTDIYHGVNFRTYANAVYLRGAQFLGALRKRMGDPAFFAFLKDYASQMTGKLATGADFFRILRTHTNINFTDLISSYFQYPH